MKHFLKVLVVVLVAFSITACSATPTRRSFKEFWKDQKMGTKVRYSMMKDKDVKFAHMKVNMWRGVATITGRAVSDYEKERAEQLAMNAKGVTGVNNYLEVVSQFASKDQVTDTKTTSNNSATANNNKTNASTKVGAKGRPIKEENLSSVSTGSANKSASAPIVATDAATSKKSPVITVPSLDRTAATNKEKVAKVATAAGKKTTPAKPTALKQIVAARKPAATPVNNVATTAKPAQIMSQQEAATWYKKINETPTKSTTSPSEFATRKDVSQPTTVSIPVTPALAPVTPTVQGPENDLAREAADELRRLRTPSTPAN